MFVSGGRSCTLPLHAFNMAERGIEVIEYERKCMRRARGVILLLRDASEHRRGPLIHIQKGNLIEVLEHANAPVAVVLESTRKDADVARMMQEILNETGRNRIVEIYTCRPDQHEYDKAVDSFLDVIAREERLAAMHRL